MTIVVRTLSVTAVKGTRLRRVEQVQLDLDGARGNRRYFVIDERDRMLNGKQLGELQSVVAESVDGSLSLTFPGGRVVAGEVALGAPIATRFFSRPRQARLLEGPWSQALSEYAGRELRIVDGGPAPDRGVGGGVSLISLASLQRLAEEAGEPDIDSRRFRMLIEIDGVAAHAEDRWVCQSARVGEATVRWGGHVGRCLITSRDPETGVIDLPTLDILGAYRGDEESTERLPFGIYGEVVSAGRVRVGDAVELSE